MVIWTVVIVLYVFMHYYSYKRISSGLSLSGGWKVFLKISLTLGGSLFFVGALIRFLFSIDVYPLFFFGGVWVFAMPVLCALCFLETGLSMVFPSKTRWWVAFALILWALRLFILSRAIPYDEVIPDFRQTPSWLIGLTIYLTVAVLLYKIIAETSKASIKKRGGLIILFSIGPVLTFFGISVIVIILLFAVYAVVFVRIAAGFNLSKKAKRFLMALFCLGFIISIPQMTWWGNGLGIPLLYHIGGTWYGMMAMAVTLFILESGVSLIFPSYRRRAVIITLLLLGLITAYGLTNGLRTPVVKELTVPIKNLPGHLSGFTIVQWSDLHLGDLVSPQWFRETVEKTNRLKPDLVVITGDLIDKGLEKNNRSHLYIDALEQLKAAHGIIAVTGNHEYYNYRFRTFFKIAKITGIRVLQNESLTLDNGLQIAGINDPTAAGFGEPRPSLETAMQDVDPQKPLIFLSHQPGFFAPAVKYGIDLQLSGHTHAGQIPPLSFFVHMAVPYAYGLYREGDAYIHTSCGTGLWGVPMRIFSQNEITKITLVKN